MLSKSFLALISKRISIAVEGTAHCDSRRSFGGVNVILCGDLHQFPPVAVAANEPLFMPSDPSTDTLESQLGREIYEEFSTVVILRDQKRVTDPI
jgi:hypothetical protein